MSLRRTLWEAAQQVRDEARQRWPGAPAGSTALSQFLRPDLPRTPPALRRVLEPVVAAAALGAIAMLFGVGTFSFLTLLLAAGLIYAIITRVFGIEIGIRAPGAA